MKQNLKQQSRGPARQLNGGFIHIILAVIVIVLILTFLRFDLRSLVESDTGQSNFGYLWELLGKLWHWFWNLLVTIWHKLVGLIQGLTK